LRNLGNARGGIFADGSYGEHWNGVEGPVRASLLAMRVSRRAGRRHRGQRITFVFSAAYGFFRLTDRIIGNRVSAEAESVGLDTLEMGSDAYPNG
jgi:Amt family ammonium transporter